MHHFNKLIYKNLVHGLPKLKFEKDKVCEACQKGKQTKIYFKHIFFYTSRPLKLLLHVDLFGNSITISLRRNLMEVHFKHLQKNQKKFKLFLKL